MRQKWCMSELSKNLKKRAKELGLTDAEIARRTGLPVRRYGHYATGYREPNLDTLMVICEVLDVSPNDLLGWTDTANLEGSKTDAQQSRLISLGRSMTTSQLETLLEIGSVLTKK